jgi:hypothetical protein
MLNLQFGLRAEQRAHDIVGSSLRWVVGCVAAVSGGVDETIESGGQKEQVRR